MRKMIFWIDVYKECRNFIGKKKKKKNSWPMWSGMMSQLTAGMGIFGMKDDNKDALKPWKV